MKCISSMKVPLSGATSSCLTDPTPVNVFQLPPLLSNNSSKKWIKSRLPLKRKRKDLPSQLKMGSHLKWQLMCEPDDVWQLGHLGRQRAKDKTCCKRSNWKTNEYGRGWRCIERCKASELQIPYATTLYQYQRIITDKTKPTFKYLNGTG